jgi:hypothetical protein
MQTKYLKNFPLLIQSIYMNCSNFDVNNAPIGGKWLPYFLMATALTLWLVFNIVAIESYQFSPYPLLFMNLVMYFILAAMASPSHTEESKT